MEYQIKNLDQMRDWVKEFIHGVHQKESANIITLSGDLGAGKTTLTQILAKQIGIHETITSPTFVIQKEYNVDGHIWIKKMIHIDAYRLERKEDLEYLGWNEIIQNRENLVIVEWPEMIHGINIPNQIHLEISINEDHTRTIKKTTS